MVIDGPSFRRISATSPGLLVQERVSARSTRGSSRRPLHIFESADPKLQAGNAPTVGVYLDREVSAAAVTSAVAAVTGQPSVRLVPFNTIGELARCFERGSVAPSSSGCPGNLTWAAILEQDASTTVDGFRAEYQRLAGRPATPLATLKLGPGVHGDNPDQLVVVALAQDYPRSRRSGGFRIARSRRAAQRRRVARDAAPGRNPGASRAGRKLSSGARRRATSKRSSDVLRHPFPVVLGSAGFPDATIRSALSD